MSDRPTGPSARDSSAAPRGDQVRVTIAVAVPREVAFEIFTNEIDRWWRKGPRFRRVGMSAGLIRLEAGVGGRLFESVESAGVERVFIVGHVRAWEPPARLVFTWKNETFSASEDTEVEVTFAETRNGTRVTVIHRGWAALRPDHPARHSMPADEFVRSLGGWWGDQMTSLRMLMEELRER
jgi:uncharacterized protein YndB with AHSA1/START domain